MIKTEHRQALHFGVNYLFVPLPELSEKSFIEFQRSLNEEGLAFSKFSRQSQPTMWTLGRESDPGPLRLVLGEAGPQVGQLTVQTARPNQGFEFFILEAQAACRSFTKTWPGKYQVLHRDAMVRHLYPTEDEHAFQYLWESMLGQTDDKLSVLNRNVLGGGLRIVMPPKDPEDAVIELKVESSFEDHRKMFIETQFTWGKPLDPTDSIDPEEILRQVEQYGKKEVLAFLGQRE